MLTGKRMNFAYINFPKLPEEFIPLCLNEIPRIETSKFLAKINELEDPAVRLTFIPAVVQKWLYEEIIFKRFPHISDNLMNLFTHVSQHIPDYNRGPESHPIHFDYGRNYAFNYILDPGGDNVATKWYDDAGNVIEEKVVQPFRWHMLAVKPELHSADRIQPGRRRVTIGLNWDPPVPKEEFDAREYWKDFIEDE